MEKFEDSSKSCDLSSQIIKYSKSKHFSPLDVTSAKFVFTAFTDRGNLYCKTAIKDTAQKLLSTISKGRHPTLNPFVENLVEYSGDNLKPIEVLSRFIFEHGNFLTHDIDNRKAYLEIEIEGDFLWCNLEAFAKEKDIRISKAVVQTALFRKEIKA